MADPKKSILKKTVSVHQSLLTSNSLPKPTYLNMVSNRSSIMSSNSKQKRVRTLAPVIKAPQHLKQNQHLKQKETSYSTMYKKTCNNQPIMSLSLKLSKMETSSPTLKKIKSGRQLLETPPTIKTSKDKSSKELYPPKVSKEGENLFVRSYSDPRLSPNLVLITPKICASKQSKLKHLHSFGQKQNTFSQSRFFSPKMAPRRLDEHEQKDHTEIDTSSNEDYLNEKSKGVDRIESVSSDLNIEEVKVRLKPDQNIYCSLRVQKSSIQTSFENDEHKKITFPLTGLFSPKVAPTKHTIENEQKEPMANDSDHVPASGEIEQNTLSTITTLKPSALTFHETYEDKKHNISLNKLSFPQMAPCIQDDLEHLKPMAEDKAVLPLVQKMAKIEPSEQSDKNECTEPMENKHTTSLVRPMVIKIEKIEKPTPSDIKRETAKPNPLDRLSSLQKAPTKQHDQGHTEPMENKYISSLVQPMVIKIETPTLSDIKRETANPLNRLSFQQKTPTRQHDQEHSEPMEHKHVSPLVQQIKIETSELHYENKLKAETAVPSLSSNRLVSPQIAPNEQHNQEHAEPTENKHVSPLVRQIIKSEIPVLNNEDEHSVKVETAASNLSSNGLSFSQMAFTKQHDQEHTEPTDNKHISPLVRQMVKTENHVPNNEDEFNIKPETVTSKFVPLNLENENDSSPIRPRLKQNTYSSFVIKQLHAKVNYGNNEPRILDTVIAYFKYRRMQEIKINRKRQKQKPLSFSPIKKAFLSHQ